MGEKVCWTNANGEKNENKQGKVLILTYLSKFWEVGVNVQCIVWIRLESKLPTPIKTLGLYEYNCKNTYGH